MDLPAADAPAHCGPGATQIISSRNLKGRLFGRAPSSKVSHSNTVGRESVRQQGKETTMKKLLIVCGAGHATSTIAVAKVSEWLQNTGHAADVKIYQSKIADELNRIDDYDAVISTTIVPDSIKDKVVNGLGLLTGMGADQVYTEVAKRLEL